MTGFLTEQQVADLIEINRICRRMNADLVIIGATAILIQLGDLGRLTRDIDLTVALDLDDFRGLSEALEAAGWRSQARQEHRWSTPARTMIDLLPAGPELRAAGKILWPASEFEMSLAGFEHVFDGSVLMPLGPEESIRVVSLPVVTLLKIVAWLEAPHRRAKDLEDIRLLMRRYKHDSEELFSDDVFDAELTDFDLANALLLGRDLGRIAGPEAASAIERFIARHPPGQEGDYVPVLDPGLRIDGSSDLAARIGAFARGFRGAFRPQADD